MHRCHSNCVSLLQLYEDDLFRFSLFFVQFAFVLIMLILQFFSEASPGFEYNVIGEVRSTKTECDYL